MNGDFEPNSQSSWRDNLLLYALIGVVVLLLAVGGYTAWRFLSSRESPPVPPTNQIVDSGGNGTTDENGGNGQPTPVEPAKPTLFVVDTGPGTERQLTSEEKQALGLPESAQGVVKLPEAVPGEPAPLAQIVIDETSIPPDTDGDGLSDQREQELGTNPNLIDTDGDTISDFQEVQLNRTDPLDPNDPSASK